MTREQIEQKAREMKRIYHNEWQRKNKDKCRAYNKKWRASHPDYEHDYWLRRAEKALTEERKVGAE